MHTVHIDNSQISTAVDQGMTHDKTKASGTPGHDSGSAFEGEAGKGALQMYT